MIDKVQKIREEVERLKSQLLRGACSSQIAMETRCKEEAYTEVLTILDSMQEEPKEYNGILGENIRRIDNEIQRLERLKENPICAYSTSRYTDEERKVLCEDCDEECRYAKKEKYFDPMSLAHKWDKEFDELLEPYKDSRNYKNLYIRLRYWKQNCKREFLWKWKYKKEEHVSKEIEDELNSYLGRVKATDKDMDFIGFAHHFANWQKKQMMKDAIEVEINSSRSDGKCILSGNFFEYNTGDKVKLIIIKEE